MITLQAISSLLPSTSSKANTTTAVQNQSAVQNASTADKVTISAAASNLRDVPGLGIIDITTVPMQMPVSAHFGDAATIKSAIKDDFLSHGIYVDDAYVNATWNALSDINYPIGPIPSTPLPTAPSWWRGAA